MQDIDTTSTQSLIDRYYEEEKAQREKEQTLASVNVRLDASDLAMLSIISKRFRKSREEVAQEVLSTALIDLFARIDAGERKLMARDADEAAKSIADEIAEENGVHSIEFKGGAWGNHDRQLIKLERKKAKQLDEHEKQIEELKAQLAALQANTDQEGSESDTPVEMISEEEPTAEMEENSTDNVESNESADTENSGDENSGDENSDNISVEASEEYAQEAPASMFAS